MAQGYIEHMVWSCNSNMVKFWHFPSRVSYSVDRTLKRDAVTEEMSTVFSPPLLAVSLADFALHLLKNFHLLLYFWGAVSEMVIRGT